MAAISSAQAGNWSSTSVWSGGVVPGSGDTVTIGHAVTVDSDRTCDGLTINAALTVADTFDLTVRGTVTQGNGTVTLGAASGLILDSSLGSWTWTQGTANSQSNCKIVANGTSIARAAITRTGSNYVHFDYNASYSHSCGFDLQYCDVTGVRNSAGTIGFRVNSFGVNIVRFRNCLFDGFAGAISAVDHNSANGQPYHVADCRWINTPSTAAPLTIRVTNTAHLVRCSFDRAPTVTKGASLTVEDNYFGAFISWLGQTPASWQRNFVRTTAGSQTLSPLQSITDDYHLADHTQGNPHFVTATEGKTYDGLIFEYPHPEAVDGGDCILKSNMAGGTLTIQNCLILPSASDGKKSGFLTTLGGTGDVRLYHNTAFGSDASLGALKDYTTTGLLYTQVKGNLVAASSATSAAAIHDIYHATTTTGDYVQGDACTHNGIRNPVSFTDTQNGNAVYTGYRFYSPTRGTPGANDVIGDPQFVDPTRNFATWAVHKGAASSGDTLRQKIDAGLALIYADPTLTASDLIPWVREGFRPTNEAFRNAAHDGTDIGAVEMAAADVTGPVPSSATIGADGETLTIVFDEAATHVSVPTLSISGGAVTATYASGTGTTSLVYSLSRVVYDTQSGTYSLAAGAVTDGDDNDNAAVTNQAVTNDSEEEAPEPQQAPGRRSFGYFMGHRY